MIRRGKGVLKILFVFCERKVRRLVTNILIDVLPFVDYIHQSHVAS